MKKQIPNFSDYLIDEYGTVTHTESKGIIEPIIGRRGNECRVLIKNDSWKFVRPKISRLVLMTFHPVVDVNYDWISARYIDGNKYRYSLSNLEWEFDGYVPPIDATDSRFKDTFVVIPGYSNYEVSPSGIVRNRKTGDHLTFGLSSVGYLCCRITDDSRKSTYVGLHRLMALALLSHPTDVDQLVINHKDGVKLHNQPSNIEWSSYSTNISHAYYNDLRDEVVPVYAKNASTGELKTFLSINETARFFGNANPGKIHWWLHRGIKNKVREGWFVSLTNEWT